MKKALLAAALAAVAGACATGGTAPGPADARTARAEQPRRSSSRLITLQEIADSRASNALVVVQRLRPTWLRVRGAESINRPSMLVVYVDGVRYGGPESLRTLVIGNVRSMHYHDSREATQRWGTGHTRGAIEVRTR